MTNIGLDIDLKVKNYECGLDNVLKTDFTHILNYLKKNVFHKFSNQFWLHTGLDNVNETRNTKVLTLI